MVSTLAPTVSNAASPSQFVLRAPVFGEKTGYIYFDITPEIYDRSDRSLADIRIFSVGGKETPYIIWNRTRQWERENLGVEILNRSSVPGSSTSFTLDLGGEYFKTNRLRITTSSVDFTRRVTIEGSPDNRKFVTIRDNAYIFDFTTEHKTSGTEISYPVTDYRYIRVTVWDDGEEPLTDLGGEVSIVVETMGEVRTLESKIKKISQNKNNMTTEVVIDLKHRNIPTSSVTLEVEDKNFSRDLHILSSNVDDPQQYDEVGGDLLYNISTTRFSRERLTLDYPEAQGRYLKLIIENRDNAPLDIEGVEVLGTPKKVTFLAEPGVSYFVYFDNPHTAAPSYDIEETFRYVDLDSISRWTVGEVEENPDYEPAEGGIPFSERHPWIVWGAIVLMVLVLGGIIIRMMMNVSKEGDEG